MAFETAVRIRDVHVNYLTILMIHLGKVCENSRAGKNP
mgnify:CR=1 FL=1